jgi:branched-chain amino acid transport system ATP-binding protein
MTGAVGPLLELRGVSRHFGGLVAVDGLDLTVGRGTIAGIIGPNGAGKSTTFDLVSGLTPVSCGTIILGGADITAMSATDRVAAGICRTFQTSLLFEDMTVLETVMTGCHRHGRTGILGSMLRVRSKRRDEAAIRDAAMRLIVRLGLEAEVDRRVSALSYGRRRLVEMARALATAPKLLLLDEFTSGLNPVETQSVGELIRSLADDGATVVLVEHDVPFVMGLCARVVVLNFGTRIAEGTPAEVQADPAVIAAYLGQARTGQQPRRTRRMLARGVS